VTLTVEDLIRKPHRKDTRLDRGTELTYAKEAECTPVMIRHVMRFGLGKKPRPERSRAYRVLQLHGKLP
jgi:hypothetical protein